MNGYIEASRLMKRINDYFDFNCWPKREGHLSSVQTRMLIRQELQAEESRKAAEQKEEEPEEEIRTLSENRLRGKYSRQVHILELCEGSIGARVFLQNLEAIERGEIDLFLRALDDAGIYEDDLYDLWDTCCERDTHRTAKTIRLYMDGITDEVTLHRWIREKKLISPEWEMEIWKRKQEEEKNGEEG